MDIVTFYIRMHIFPHLHNYKAKECSYCFLDYQVAGAKKQGHRSKEAQMFACSRFQL